MNFLDEVTYNIQPGEEVPDTVKPDDTVNIGNHSMEEKKGKDLDGDGDIDSDDYLAARDAAIKRAKSMKEGDLEEGKLANALGGVALLASLVLMNKINSSDPVVQRLKAEYEQAEPAKKDSIEKLLTKRLIFLDTGKFDDSTPMKEGEKEKFTYKAPKDKDKDDIKIDPDTEFEIDLKHLIQKHMKEGKSKEDTIKFTKALMAKLHNKGEVTVDGTKIVFKEIKDIKNIKAIIQQARVNRDKAIKMGNEGMADKIEGNLLKKLQSLNYNFRQDPDAMEVLGDYFDLDELDAPQDAQLALPEPPKRTANFLGPDNMDYEGGMAKSQMLKMKNYAKALCDMIEDESQLESWVQAKLTKASDYMSSVYHYLDYQRSKMNEVYKLNNRPVGDLEADGGGSIDPFIGAAYYLDGKGEKLSDKEIEALVDKYPGDLEPGGTWWNDRK